MAKIMLVEDDNNLREIYEARLQAEGYTIVSAHDGEEALVIAKAEKPDLVISDVMMPKISGFEMLDILRNTDGLKDVKVIMLTALGQTDDQQRANKLGADRYLVKSQVTLEDIVKAAHELLGEEAAPATTPDAATTTSVASAPVATPPVPPVEPEPASAPPITPTAPQPVTPDPVPAPVPTPTPAPAPPTIKPATAPPITDDQTQTSDDDDKVMAEAVNKLSADTDKKTEMSDADAAKPSDTSDKTEETKPADDQDNDKAKEDNDPQNGHVTIANKKVITPLDDKPDKDINDLLAEEEAKETASAAGATFQPTPVGAAASDKAAESTAQEEAALDAKIEDFVAGASSEPDTPTTTPAPDAASDTPKASAPETPSEPAPANTPAAQPAEPTPAEAGPVAAPSSQPAIKPIVVSEPSAAAPTSGAAPAAPQQGSDKTPPDPNTIAL